MSLFNYIPEIDVKQLAKSVKIALDNSVRDKSLWEKAFDVYQNNPTQVTMGVVLVAMTFYAVYLFKFDDKYSYSNHGFKVTKYKEEIERFKKMESEKLKTNSNKDTGGIF